MGFCNLLLLTTVFLTLWFTTSKGEVKPCDFPQFKHGRLYYEESRRPYFPVPIGKEYSYYCDNGFTTPSQSYWDYLRCTVNGWEPEVPCLRQCIFHYVENGESSYWQRRYIEGQSAKVQCYSGYSLPNGQDTMICTENGWSPPPKCVRINSTKICGPPPPIDNGDTTSFPLQRYIPSSSVEYQCQSLYQLQGNKTIICINGEWSDPPKCLHPCIISKEIMEKHNITFRWEEKQKRYYQSGETQEFKCKNGHHLATTQPLITICINGQINYPTCTKSH
ncbi:complement factor H-related protein B isoform X3 [Rattus norvegicus]|uniref:complement factor H-related protein B isoform X3 n=1 Tax=Rattus norvegicus TaxID=10116 RepID=UPI0003D0F6D3|nr:complement factor H-related protein B isoform X4 [Rattus norvegicus]